ncbi:MAG: type II secretion system F family protein [Planctomycetota bacterium]
MPLFDYSGQLPSGSLFQGTLEAADAPAAQVTLEQLGIRVLTVRPACRAAFVAPLSLADFTFFNEQLAALAKTGLPLEEGLRQLAADVGSRKLKSVFKSLADDLAAGTPLPQALERQQQRFPPRYAQVAYAGLASGDLAGTLYGLTTHLRLKSGFRRVLLEVLAYPTVVLVLILLVSSFLMRYVVPMMAELFTEMLRDAGRPLHLPVLLQFATIWPVFEWGLIVLLCALLLLVLAVVLPVGRGLRELLLRRIPGVARVYRSSVLARFAHTSALAAYSGVPLPDLVRASGAASGSVVLHAAAERVGRRLTAGDPLAKAAADERELPSLWVCAVEVAGPRGDLPGALAEVARTYELRAQQSASAVRAVLGPLLFVILAVSVGGLVVGLVSVMTAFLRGMMAVTMLAA